MYLDNRRSKLLFQTHLSARLTLIFKMFFMKLKQLKQFCSFYILSFCWLYALRKVVDSLSLCSDKVDDCISWNGRLCMQILLASGIKQGSTVKQNGRHWFIIASTIVESGIADKCLWLWCFVAYIYPKFT